jgi:hypothetical protein
LVTVRVVEPTVLVAVRAVEPRVLLTVELSVSAVLAARSLVAATPAEAP